MNVIICHPTSPLPPHSRPLVCTAREIRPQNAERAPRIFERHFKVAETGKLGRHSFFNRSTLHFLVGKTPYKAFSEWFISNGTRGTYVEEPLDKPECNPSCCSKLCLKCRKPKPTVAYDKSTKIIVGSSKWSS